MRTSAGRDDSGVQQKADKEVCFVLWSLRGDCILTIIYPYLELLTLLRAKFGLQAHSVSHRTQTRALAVESTVGGRKNSLPTILKHLDIYT